MRLSFAAPAAIALLRDRSLDVAEDHLRVGVPQTGNVLVRGRVTTWTCRSLTAIASWLAFASRARTWLHSLRTVRVALHLGEAAKEAIPFSIEKMLRCFVAGRQHRSYHSLATMNQKEGRLPTLR